jgi:hypothetical protein
MVIQVKTCSRCIVEKDITGFHKRAKSKDGYATACKQCIKKLTDSYYNKNKEKVIKQSLEYYYNNLHKVKKAQRLWDVNNKGTRNAIRAKRRAIKFLATPSWANLTAIRCKYQVAAILNKEGLEKWHVDHIVPLQGADVCGLHVEYNLKVIPAKENLSKGNKHGYTLS